MFDKSNIICFGEVLWDIYPDNKRLGGAPFNVAAHLTKLGSQGHLISRIGLDDLGKEIQKAIIAQNVSTHTLQIDNNFPTGTVKVELDENGIPDYIINEPVAWDFIHINLKNLELIKKSDAFVYGSLACRSERNFASLKDFAQLSKLNVCDLNIRQNYYSKKIIKELISISDILKVNDEEYKLLSHYLGIKEDNLYDRLADEYKLQTIIKTKGADGAEVFNRGKLFKNRGTKVKAIDTVGSGDAFLASFLHYYLLGSDMNLCLKKACDLGAFVATKKGAIPNYKLLTSKKVEVNG